MKFVFTILLITAVLHGSAQNDTLAPYLQYPIVPPFKIQLADSSWFYKKDLPKKKNVLVLYFSPDCGHCQLETDDLITHLKQLKNLQVVMITSKPLDEMINFQKHYLLDRFPQVTVGSDAAHFVSRYFAVKFTPFSALYNKKGDLIKEWREGINWEELVNLTN